MGLYAIVHFTAEDEVEVVPQSWITGCKCRWPDECVLKGAALRKAIETRRPSEPEWPTYDVKIFKELGMYMGHHNGFLCILMVLDF